MSSFYNDFFRSHERLFRDFERDFDREFNPRLGLGLGSTFRQELPMLSWFDDDFFTPIQHHRHRRSQQQSTADSEIEKNLQELTNKFEEDYKKLRESYL